MADDIDKDKPVTAAEAAIILADERNTRRTAPLSYWREHTLQQADGGVAWPASGNAARVTEANSSSIANAAVLGWQTSAYGCAHGAVLGGAGSSYDAQFRVRTGVIALTEAAGAIAATNLAAGVAGYKTVVKLLAIWSPQTDAASTWTIASEAGGGITGPTTFAIALTAYACTQFGAVAANQAGFPVHVYNTTANKAITIQAAGLPAVGTTYYCLCEYWYE